MAHDPPGEPLGGPRGGAHGGPGGGPRGDPRRRRALALGAGLVFVFAVALHLPWITTPFGFGEQNPGCYFGTFVRNYERLGFVETRGLPLGNTVLDDARLGIPYLHHPPGLSWLLYLSGTAEWQMRLPTVIGTALAALLLFLVLARWLSIGSATAAGALFAAVPCVSFEGQASYEGAVLPLGMAMVWAMLRLREGSPTPVRNRFVLGVCAFVGPWIDWQFVFHCAALVPLWWPRRHPRPLRTLHDLSIPAICAVAALISILAWRAAVAADENLPPLGDSAGFAELLRATVLDGPPMGAYLAGAADTVARSFTVPVVLAAVLGLVALVRRCPRLALAFAVMGVLFPLAFRNHGISHGMYYAGLAPLVAASCAALVDSIVAAVRRGPGGAFPSALHAALASVLVLVPTADRTLLVANTRTDFLKDLGAVLTEAAGERDADGKLREPYVVVHSFTFFYGYYVDANNHALVFPTRDPALLRAALQNVQPGSGARYLWLRLAQPHAGAGAPPQLVDPPGLAELLAPFKKRRVPELEVRIDISGNGDVVEFGEAWLVTLREP